MGKNNFEFCAFADEAAADLQGQIKAMTDNGITMLEIRGINGKNISDTTKDEAKKIKRELDDNGIKVWAIGSPTGKSELGNDDFNEVFEKFCYMLELAGILGAQRYRLFSFYGISSRMPETDFKSKRDELIERLNRFAQKAKDSSVVLCHENEKDIYGEKAPECLDIHKSIPGIKAVFDPANFIQAGEDVLQAWEMLEPYVDYIHIKDAKKDGSVVPAGYGIGSLPEIVRRFAKIGGKVLTLEPHLSVFSGSDGLERGETKIENFVYPSQRAAFDAAAKAMKKIAMK
ncbi:MAG: sugar phosphate isomerase/epimerase [Oscillospiraceae bacterium]|nr:sugar phosphate isomerase/epimerase [Oscillospiraceae bacterium]